MGRAGPIQEFYVGRAGPTVLNVGPRARSGAHLDVPAQDFDLRRIGTVLFRKKSCVCFFKHISYLEIWGRCEKMAALRNHKY